MQLVHLLLLFLFLSTAGHCQKNIEQNYKVEAGDKIVLDFKFADDIKISSWNRDEVRVKVKVNINNNENNDAFRLEKSKSRGEIEIKSIIDNLENLHKETSIRNKRGKMITTKNVGMELSFEVTLPKKAQLSVNSISGNITITGLSRQLEIETISGFVDLSLPAKQKALLTLNTITGEMYTDFDINTKSKGGLNEYIKGKFTTELNGGGEEISLKTISGDIFLRKER